LLNKVANTLKSKTVQVYAVWKLGSHSQSLKYELIIDSEKVLWKKVEKEL